MVFAHDDIILSIKEFELKKYIEKDKFLIKLIDLKTKNEYLLYSFNNLEEQESKFRWISNEIRQFYGQTKNKLYLKLL